MADNDRRSKLEGTRGRLAKRMKQEAPATIPELKKLLYPEFDNEYKNKSTFKRTLHRTADDLEEQDQIKTKKVAGTGSLKNRKITEVNDN